jgi:uncharacterized protein YdaU (DUF1376 family)
MGLSMEEHGAYFLLLLAAWQRGGSLENDEKTLSFYVKKSRTKWKKIAPRILPFFTNEGDILVHEHLSFEYVKAVELTKKNSLRASRAAAEMWRRKRQRRLVGNRCSEHPSSNAPEMQDLDSELEQTDKIPSERLESRTNLSKLALELPNKVSTRPASPYIREVK